MSTTPQTDMLYKRHIEFRNEEEAADAVMDFRDLCAKLERELAEARKDSARLNTMLKNGWSVGILCEQFAIYDVCDNRITEWHKTERDAIDDAMKKEGA